jgi:hypothetical protein
MKQDFRTTTSASPEFGSLPPKFALMTVKPLFVVTDQE